MMFLAREVLGLSVAEFWRLTPAVYHALLAEAVLWRSPAPAEPEIIKARYADTIGW